MTGRKNTKLPEGVVPYGRSPQFLAKSLPEKLKKAHDLKAGTWGRLNVIAGTVNYFTLGQPGFIVLFSGDKFVIQPQEKHYIAVSDDAELFIEFCAAPKEEKPNPPSSAPCFAHENELDDNGYMHWTKTHSD